MTYAQQVQLAWAVAGAASLIGLIQLGNADLLGLSPRVLAWLGIVASFLTIAATWLPSIRGRAADPTFLADRISELPPKKRKTLATTMANRATKITESNQA